jgi:molybdopterin synthase sulfur carrier subunit
MDDPRDATRQTDDGARDGARGLTVRYFATIRSYAGEAERRLDGAPPDLHELLVGLAERYEGRFRAAVLPEGKLGEALIVLVNGRNVRCLQGLDTPLADGDEVSIFPLVAGG